MAAEICYGVGFVVAFVLMIFRLSRGPVHLDLGDLTGPYRVGLGYAVLMAVIWPVVLLIVIVQWLYMKLPVWLRPEQDEDPIIKVLRDAIDKEKKS